MRRMEGRGAAGSVEVETKLMAGIVASMATIPPQFMTFVVELPPASRTTAQSTDQEVMVDKVLPVSLGEGMGA